MPGKNEHGLTPQQETFATAVAAGLSQAEAYRAAYPKSKTWKDESVHSKSCQLAARANVKQRIAALTSAALKKNDVTIERVIRELALIAFGSKRDVMKWGPSGVQLIDSESLTQEQAALVAEVSETTSDSGGSIKLKTHDKVKALELLGRHLGAFNDKLNVSGLTVVVKDYTGRKESDASS